MRITNRYGMSFSPKEITFVFKESELSELASELLYKMTGVKTEVYIENDYEDESYLIMYAAETKDEKLDKTLFEKINKMDSEVGIFDAYGSTTEFIMKHLFDDENITYFVQGDYVRRKGEELLIFVRKNNN